MRSAVDTLLLVRKDAREVVTLSCEKASDFGSFSPIKFKVEEYPTNEAPVLRVLSAENEESRKPPTVNVEKVVEALREFGADGATSTQLELASGLTRSTFKRALKELKLRDDLVHVSGRYVLKEIHATRH